MCQIFTLQKYRFGNIISTPREMCVHELYIIASCRIHVALCLCGPYDYT